jgi:hypothetical protein
MSNIVKEEWIELCKIRIRITNQLPAVTDRAVRDSLFEARQAIGSAMLHLERVEYMTGTDSSDSEDQVEEPPL